MSDQVRADQHGATTRTVTPTVGWRQLFVGGRARLTVGLVLVETVAAVQVSVVAAVMPAVSRDLHGIALYGLVFSGYTLAGLAATPLAGYLADRYGPGRPFAITTGVFVLGSLLCGLAPNMAFLAAARVIQGWGGAALYTIAYGAIAKAYPESGRARMLALLSGAWVVPGLVGPGFGAIVTQTIGWRWCFFGLLPIVAIAFQMAYRDLARLSGRTAIDAPPWQWPVILAVGTGLMVTGLADSSPMGIVFDVVGLILFVPAVRRVLPRGTFRLERGLSSAVLVIPELQKEAAARMQSILSINVHLQSRDGGRYHGIVHRGGDGRLEAAVLAADTRNSCLSLARITAPLCESDEAAGLASATVRALAPSKEALDAPLSLRSPQPAGACYQALGRTPGRDSHPLAWSSFQDATSPDPTASTRRLRRLKTRPMLDEDAERTIASRIEGSPQPEQEQPGTVPAPSRTSTASTR